MIKVLITIGAVNYLFLITLELPRPAEPI